MKNGSKMILLGTISLSCGFLIGFKTCQKITFKGVVSGAKKLLGIKSPSKIFYDTGAKVKDKDIVLASRSDAEEVLTQLRTLLNDYGDVTVSDLYDLVGITSKFTDNKYGWTDLKTAVIKGVRTGYLLDLPTPQEIK